MSIIHSWIQHTDQAKFICAIYNKNPHSINNPKIFEKEYFSSNPNFRKKSEDMIKTTFELINKQIQEDNINTWNPEYVNDLEQLSERIRSVESYFNYQDPYLNDLESTIRKLKKLNLEQSVSAPPTVPVPNPVLQSLNSTNYALQNQTPNVLQNPIIETMENVKSAPAMDNPKTPTIESKTAPPNDNQTHTLETYVKAPNQNALLEPEIVKQLTTLARRNILAQKSILEEEKTLKKDNIDKLPDNQKMISRFSELQKGDWISFNIAKSKETSKKVLGIFLKLEGDEFYYLLNGKQKCCNLHEVSKFTVRIHTHIEDVEIVEFPIHEGRSIDNFAQLRKSDMVTFVSKYDKQFNGYYLESSPYGLVFIDELGHEQEFDYDQISIFSLRIHGET